MNDGCETWGNALEVGRFKRIVSPSTLGFLFLISAFEMTHRLTSTVLL